jgi:hypothetical protein
MIGKRPEETAMCDATIDRITANKQLAGKR